MGSTSFGSSTIIHRVDSSSSVYRMYCELCDYAKYSSYYEYWFYKTLLVDYLGYAPDDECKDPVVEKQPLIPKYQNYQ